MADDVEMTPISPAEGGSVPPKVAPFGAAPAAAASAAPAAAPSVSPSAGVSTIKLKPVIRKPMIHKPTIGGAKPAAPVSPVVPPAPAKKATQNLKSVTGPIPVQATLKKTGIIAEGIITPQQQQAAKSKTSRISLESAIGVAPAKEGPAPLKTIRLRRPTDLKPAGPTPLIQKPAEPASQPAAAPVMASAAPEPAPAPAPAPAAEESSLGESVTQKKTLKLHRPSGVGIKPPSIGIQSPAAAPEGVQDIPDLGGDVSELSPLSPMDMGATSSSGSTSGVPSWLAAISLVASLAGLLVAGYLVYEFYCHVAETTANQIF